MRRRAWLAVGLVGSLILGVGALPSARAVGPFVDVDPDAYYADAVEWARAEGVTSGAGAARFEPERPVTRAEAITLLWRAAGSPRVQPMPFLDVPRGAYYASAVSWANASGVAMGVAGSRRFEPAGTTTRAEAVAFLWRHEGSPPAPAPTFTDTPARHWSAGAIGWAQTGGIALGVRDGRFEPGGRPSRAEFVTMLWRAFGSPIPPSTTMPPPTGPPGWRLAWSDEFSSGLDTSVWKPYHNTYGDGNNELACLTPGNVGVSGGSLRITARRQQVTCPNGSVRQYSSGFLGTRETGTFFPRFGRFEIRARLPHGQGLWPAFWLRHRDGAPTAEVDVMEYFHSQVPGQSTGTLHLDRRPNVSKRSIPFEAPTGSPGWHTWAVEIEPVSDGVRFRFILDGAAYHTYTDTGRLWAEAASPEGTWDIAVNLAVGGNWTGRPDDALGYLQDLDRCAQAGSPPGACRAEGIRRWDGAPATFEVDHVRVYTR